MIDIAAMAGYRRDPGLTRLGTLVPDVLMFHPHGSAFLGEGKITERPDCAATLERMLRYFERLHQYFRLVDGPHIVAVCVSRVSEIPRWESALRVCCLDAGEIAVDDSGCTYVDDNTAVAWVAFRAALERVRLRSGRT